MVKNSLDKNQMFVFNNLIIAILNNTNYIDVNKISKEFNLDYKTTKKLIASLVKLEITKFRKANDIHYVFVPIAQIVFEEGKAFFESPSKFLELVREKDRYTTFDMKIQRQLSSKYAYMFYEIASLCYNHNNKIGYTEKYSVDEFKSLLGFSEDDYKDYKHFKRQVINKSIQNLSDHTEYLLTLKEIKKGAKVLDIYFEIRKKEESKENTTEQTTLKQYKPAQAKIETVQQVQEEIKVINIDTGFKMLSNEQENYTHSKLINFGYSEEQAQKLITEHSQKFIEYAIIKSKIENRTNVANKAGYFNKVLLSFKEQYIAENKQINEQKEQNKIYHEKQEELERKMKEKEEIFKEQQETLSRDILEQEPEIFCKELFKFMDMYINKLNWGFPNHPDFVKNKEEGKEQINIEIAKDIRNKFRACQSLRDFKNLIKYDYSFMFKEVFNLQGHFIENDDFYYKSWIANKGRSVVEMPFAV